MTMRKNSLIRLVKGEKMEEDKDGNTVDESTGTMNEQTQNVMEGQVASVADITAFIGKFMDPTEEGTVKLYEESKVVVINSTQISLDHISAIQSRIDGSGWKVVVAPAHPSTVQL